MDTTTSYSEKTWLVGDGIASIYPRMANAYPGMRINSGWRSPYVNKATIGAAANSKHMFGEALDIRPSGRGPNQGVEDHWDKLMSYSPDVLYVERNRNGVRYYRCFGNFPHGAGKYNANGWAKLTPIKEKDKPNAPENLYDSIFLQRRRRERLGTCARSR